MTAPNLFDYHTIEPNGRGQLDVYSHGEYEDSSVLAGQNRRVFRDSYPTIEAALVEFPDADVLDHSSKVPMYMPIVAPAWFDPADAGECWHEDDY